MRLYNATMKINRLEMLKANIGLELIDGHDKLQKFMLNILKGRTMDELKRQAGILGGTIHNNAKFAESIVNASFHNATFSTRIWGNQAVMKSDLDKLLQTGVIRGKNANVLANELRKYYIGEPKKDGGAVFNAKRLMRTELARVQTDAQMRSYEENGIEEYEFIANMHSNPCKICAELNGKHFKVKDMRPGVNASPMHPMCRCSTAPHEDSAEYEAWLDFLSKGGTTAQWNMIKKAKFSVDNIAKSYGSGKIKPKNILSMNLQFFASKEKQYGKKIGKHAQDYGLNPSIQEDRDKMHLIIDDIVDNYELIKIGDWRGQENEVLFYIKGEDVVILSKDKEFITILKGGVTNERVKNARVEEVR